MGKLPPDEAAHLNEKLNDFRKRFRTTLAGGWGNPEIVPFGYQYVFNADGTGTQYRYRGFGCTENPMQWRSVGNWCIEYNIEYSFEDDEDADEPEEEEDEGEEDEPWMRFKYDFVIANVGYCHDVVLCEAATAGRYRQQPGGVGSGELGMELDDGPLCHFEVTGRRG